MALKIIVAVSQNGAIGIEGSIPWRLPEDLKRFSKLTKGNSNNAVIVGRRTWESIPSKYRPLPGRLNIVLTRNAVDLDAWPSLSLYAALKKAKQWNCEDIWIIGGQSLYQEVMAKYVNRTDEFRLEAIHLTLIDAIVEGDTFFPFFDPMLFQKIDPERTQTSENGMTYKFLDYKRH